jgi:hypothetical protein
MAFARRPAGLFLERVTLGWNVVGIVVLAFAAWQARSVALAGFVIVFYGIKEARTIFTGDDSRPAVADQSVMHDG